MREPLSGYPGHMTYRDSIPTLVAYAVQKDTLVHADARPVDDDGFDWDRFIPGDRVAGDCRLDDTHPDAYWDRVDDVLRCTECDEPL